MTKLKRRDVYCISRCFHEKRERGIRCNGGDPVKKARLWGVVFILAAVLSKPEIAVTGAQGAMQLWYTSVAPALFPFLALMPLLTGSEACAMYGRLFSKMMGPLFGLSGAAAPAVVIAMLSGSPGGAIALNRIGAETEMKRSDVLRISSVMGGVSPAYLIIGVGQGLYGSAALGRKLAAAQIAIQLILLAALRPCFEAEVRMSKQEMISESEKPIRKAVENLLAVCGYMVLFSVIASVAAAFAGKKIGTALLLLLDLPSGLAELAESEMSAKLIFQGAALGFGGLCIFSQNKDALRLNGFEQRQYLCVRCISATLMAIVCMVLAGFSKASVCTKTLGRDSTYAASLLVAAILSIPAMWKLQKNLFLNK